MNVNAKVHLLDLQQFSADRVVDQLGLHNALNYLECCLGARDVNMDAITEELLSVPNLFAYIMSVWPRAPKFIKTLLNHFPTEVNLFLNSCTRLLLSQLSHLLVSLPLQHFYVETSYRYKVYLEDALPVLTILATEDFTRHTVASMRMTSRRGAQQNSTVTGAALFENLGVGVPYSATEATKTAEDIMCDLKDVLRFQLRLLLDGDLASSLKNIYFPATEHAASEAVAHEPEPLPTEAELDDMKVLAYPSVQPLKAAQYFDNADGFGQWCLLFSDSATRRLRELKNSDKKIFQIVVKKIKQLSNGCFSRDNQRRLNRSSTGVPVFEAIIQHNLRLVYQVDCMPDFNHVERQVIQAYDIQKDTQVDRRMWDSVGRRLASRGKEYRRRCTYRVPVQGSGNDVYLPASFPASLPQCHLQENLLGAHVCNSRKG